MRAHGSVSVGEPASGRGSRCAGSPPVALVPPAVTPQLGFGLVAAHSRRPRRPRQRCRLQARLSRKGLCASGLRRFGDGEQTSSRVIASARSADVPAVVPHSLASSSGSVGRRQRLRRQQESRSCRARNGSSVGSRADPAGRTSAPSPKLPKRSRAEARSLGPNDRDPRGRPLIRSLDLVPSSSRATPHQRVGRS